MLHSLHTDLMSSHSRRYTNDIHSHLLFHQHLLLHHKLLLLLLLLLHKGELIQGSHAWIDSNGRRGHNDALCCCSRSLHSTTKGHGHLVHEGQLLLML